MAGSGAGHEQVVSSRLAGFDQVRLGHWTDRRARTGVTVVILPEGSLGAAEVRGGAPATREFEVLTPAAAVQRLDAVVLSGGSAFGLAAVDGVVGTLGDLGRGYATAGGAVPIVAGMALFDLTVGSGAVRPGAGNGAAATTAALGEDGRVGEATGQHREALGGIGAGAGATVSKWRGRAGAVAGGLVSATLSEGGFTVSALMAVNAFGDIAGHGWANDPWPSLAPTGEVADFGAFASTAGQNTTIGLVVCDAALTKGDCLLLAQGAHDGLARMISPPHCRVDGDAVVAAATGALPLAPENNPTRTGQLEQLRWMAVRVTADALASLPAEAPSGPIPWADQSGD